MSPITICPHWPASIALFPIITALKLQCWELGSVVSIMKRPSLFWITTKYHSPDIHFLSKPWRPPDGIVTNAMFGTLVDISFGLILRKVLTNVYGRKLKYLSYLIGYWVWRELLTQFHVLRGLILAFNLMSFGEPWSGYSFIDRVSGSSCATQMQPPIVNDTMKAGVSAPCPDLERRMGSQSHSLTDVDFVDPEYLLGDHSDIGIAIEGWFYFDSEDRSLAHSADLNLQTLNYMDSTQVNNAVSTSQPEALNMPLSHALVSAVASYDLDDLGDNCVATFDSNSAFWMCDNSATRHMCNDANMFHGQLLPSTYDVNSATGTSSQLKMGTVVLSVADNDVWSILLHC